MVNVRKQNTEMGDGGGSKHCGFDSFFNKSTFTYSDSSIGNSIFVLVKPTPILLF